MQVNGPEYSIDIKAYWYDNSDQLIVKNSDSLLSDLVQFKELKLITQLNSWPVFELTIVHNNWTKFVGIKKFDFNIQVTNSKTLKFEGTPILSRIISTTETQWVGYMGDPENIFHVTSEYLSSTWKESINKLTDRFKIKFNHQFDYVNNDGFFIFNETPKSALTRMLTAVGEDYQYIITFDSCSLMSSNEGKQCDKLTKTNTIDNFNLLDNIEKVNIIKSENPFSDYTPANEHEVTDEHYYRTKNENKVHHNYQRKGIKSYLYSRSYNENILDNIKYSDSFQLKSTLNLDRYIPVDIGDKIQYPRKYNTPNWIIMAKEITIGLTRLITVLKLGNDKKEFI